MSVVCKVCEKEMKSLGGLHKHIKSHNLTKEEYYHEYYPREDRFTGELIPFDSYNQYMNASFKDSVNRDAWCLLSRNKKEVERYLVETMKSRIQEKGLSYAPCHVEIEAVNLPSIGIYRHIFGSYSKACSEAGVEPMFNKGVDFKKFKSTRPPKDLHVFIDSREQKPLKFDNSSELKLDFGDYGTSGEYYDYTFIDRKSLEDFRGTLGASNFERFREELERAKYFGCYVYILTECWMQDIVESDQKYKEKFDAKTSSKYLFHNMRLLQHEFKGHCQFVFSGSRKGSEFLIPRLLHQGKRLWDVDIQYFIDEAIKSKK